jgi:hypothetical protein
MLLIVKKFHVQPGNCPPLPKMLDGVGIGSPFEDRKSIWGKPRDLSRGKVQSKILFAAASAASRHCCQVNGKRLKPLNNGVKSLFHTG